MAFCMNTVKVKVRMQWGQKIKYIKIKAPGLAENFKHMDREITRGLKTESRWLHAYRVFLGLGFWVAHLVGVPNRGSSFVGLARKSHSSPSKKGVEKHRESPTSLNLSQELIQTFPSHAVCSAPRAGETLAHSHGSWRRLCRGAGSVPNSEGTQEMAMQI